MDPTLFWLNYKEIVPDFFSAVFVVVHHQRQPREFGKRCFVFALLKKNVWIKNRRRILTRLSSVFMPVQYPAVYKRFGSPALPQNAIFLFWHQYLSSEWFYWAQISSYMSSLVQGMVLDLFHPISICLLTQKMSYKSHLMLSHLCPILHNLG